MNLDKSIKLKTKKKKDKPEHYVTNEQLIEELHKSYECNGITSKMAKYVNKIVDGISKSPNFINYDKKYDWLGDMKSDATFRICKAIYDKGFKIIPEDQIGKPKLDKNGNQVYVAGTLKKDNNGNTVLDEEGNPVYNMDNPVKVTQNNAFGYFSMIAWHAFQNRIKQEKKHVDTMVNYREKMLEDFELEFGVKPHDSETENIDE